MGDLEFFLYKVPSEAGDWLAAFEGDELIFLGCYSMGKKLVEDDLTKLFKTYYNFDAGKFSTVKWTKGNFWKKKHKIKLMGTEFQMKVWLELLKIPHGKTMTYSELAKKVGKPAAVRAVASAVARNPVSFWVPCHRVVGKGKNQLGYHWGSDMKRTLLTMEGVL